MVLALVFAPRKASCFGNGPEKSDSSPPRLILCFLKVAHPVVVGGSSVGVAALAFTGLNSMQTHRDRGFRDPHDHSVIYWLDQIGTEAIEALPGGT